jgi:hypothetical protein
MILAAALGDMPIGRVILGNDVSEHFAPVWDDFNRSDRDLDADGTWVDCGPSVDYRACIEAGKMRINIPDGLPSAMESTSYMRYDRAVVTDADGHIECQVAARGDYYPTASGNRGYATAVYAKVSPVSVIQTSHLYPPDPHDSFGDGLYTTDEATSRDSLYETTPSNGFEDGVGIWLEASRLLMVVRRNGVDRLVADFGNFAVGDIIRCNFAGPTYTMYCKGQRRGSWTAAVDQIAESDLNRYLGIRVHGGNESGTGPRRFSPALDYVEYA